MNELQQTKEMIDKNVYQMANYLGTKIHQGTLYGNEESQIHNECELNDDDEIDYDSIKEIMQYFIVSEWLGRKLIKKDEFVIETDDLFIWGRTCCGQALHMDSVLQDIAA